jgi:hypothetical protein
MSKGLIVARISVYKVSHKYSLRRVGIFAVV